MPPDASWGILDAVDGPSAGCPEAPPGVSTGECMGGVMPGSSWNQYQGPVPAEQAGSPRSRSAASTPRVTLTGVRKPAGYFLQVTAGGVTYRPHRGRPYFSRLVGRWRPGLVVQVARGRVQAAGGGLVGAGREILATVTRRW
jgi:hypothetical protein